MVERGHIDIMLRDWLRRDGVADEAQACYVYPAVGSYFEHASDCDPANFGSEGQTRPAGWDKKSCSIGTRVEDDDKGQRSKYLIKWKGNAKQKRDRDWIPFPKDELLHSKEYEWKSYRDLPTASSSKGTGKKKEEMTARAKRQRNKWRQREQMRNFVTTEAEAATGCAGVGPGWVGLGSVGSGRIDWVRWGWFVWWVGPGWMGWMDWVGGFGGARCGSVGLGWVGMDSVGGVRCGCWGLMRLG